MNASLQLVWNLLPDDFTKSCRYGVSELSMRVEGVYRMIVVIFRQMLDLFDENPEIKDALNAKPLIVTAGTVSFENVTFTYEPSKAVRPTIDGISFEVTGGKTTALVGSSGGG